MKVYTVTNCFAYSRNHDLNGFNFNVIGVAKDLEGAKRIAWEEINKTLPGYDSSSSYEVTYKPSADRINRELENLKMAVYGHVASLTTGDDIVLSVKVHENEMT